jgi:nucleoside-diphosphate-sugar epimerase
MILVTGGLGYVGSALVGELLDAGHRVRIVDAQWFGNPLHQHPGLEVVVSDLRDLDSAWLDGVSAVCHLAALSNDPTSDFMPEESVACNVGATRSLAEAVAEHGDRRRRDIRFLFASTCSVYHAPPCGDRNVQLMTEELDVDPSSNYSRSKRQAELALLAVAARAPSFCPIVLRKGTIFGLAPRMRFDLVVNAFTLDAWSRRLLTVHGSGESWRPLLHVRDAVDTYLRLLGPAAAPLRCGIFNVLHKNYRVLELAHWVAEILERHRGVDVRVKRDRSSDGGARSYYVDGSRLAAVEGMRLDRGTTDAVLEIWDALERGDFGPSPEHDPRYFNIRHLREHLAAPMHEPARARRPAPLGIPDDSV